MRNAPLSLLVAFSGIKGSKTSEIWRRKNFLPLGIRKACMLPYCTLNRSVVEIRLQDTFLPHYSKTLRSGVSFCWVTIANSLSHNTSSQFCKARRFGRVAPAIFKNAKWLGQPGRNVLCKTDCWCYEKEN